MERINHGSASTAATGDRLRRGRLERTHGMNPASRHENRSLRAAGYDQFARSVYRDLNPRGPLEQLVTRQAIRSAWRLKENLDDVDPLDGVVATATERAARSLEVAITTLDMLQGRRIEESVQPDLAEFPTDDDLFIASNEWPVVPEPEAEPLAENTEDDVPIWRDRLMYDFEVSDHSPVIKGTWITVSHVVSLIIDGATWADILRAHPELIEADLRMCVAYAVAEERAQL